MQQEQQQEQEQQQQQEQAAGEMQQRVEFYALDSSDYGVLHRLMPSCVIMYDADVTFLRQLEVYQARCGEESPSAHSKQGLVNTLCTQ